MALLKIVSGQKPREIAVQVLGGRSERHFTEELLDGALTHASLPPVDRRLCQELVYGIVRWQATLDWLIGRKTDNRIQKPALQNLLRLGLYQIFWLDRIPDHAAVHVTVELAKQRGFGPQAGFVNAILRGYLREYDATRALLDQIKQERPALGYSHPQWLVDRWLARWGKDTTLKLLEWNNSTPKTYARVNTLKIEPAKLLPLWREENVEYDFVRHDWFPENLVFELKSYPPLEVLSTFQKGFFYVQDPSTLLAINELEPRPGEVVLDLCAAPGGKLTYLAQLMQNQGRIFAHDISPDRIKLMVENCARLGVTCVEPGSARDGMKPDTVARQFDRILVDAPCSNTGVMRRRVDLRWRVNQHELKRLRQTQLDLLMIAVQSLKPGATIVYSTCSLEPEENRSVVDTILAHDKTLSLDHEREVLPFVERTDGAYIAKISRSPDV